MAKTTGAHHLAHALHGYGVTHVFHVPAVLLRTLAEMEDLPIRRVVTHGEKSAAYMADGYARASFKPGICMAQNIGGSNLAAGLRDAYMASVPVIALTGGPSASSRHRNYYQEVEDFSQFDAVTKFNATVDNASRLPDLLRQAFRAATSGAPGPVHLRFPGVTGESVEQAADIDLHIEPSFSSYPAFRPEPDPDQVRVASEKLLSAKRPIIVAGGGVVSSQATAEVVTLAEQLNIPVATSLNAKGTIPDTHRLSIGVVGTYSRESANRALSEADLVFFIGSHTGGQVTTHWKVPAPATTVIHLDIEPMELGRNYHNTIPLLGDAKASLRSLLAQVNAKKGSADSSWTARVTELNEKWQAMEKPQLTSEAVPMRPERLCAAIAKVLPDDGIVVSDTGHSGMWSGTLIDFRSANQRYIRCAGSLGWALPGAIGVKCAKPDHAVVCFAGDGAAYYHIAELETAARYGINIVLVVNNNSALNQEIHLYDTAYGGKRRGNSDELWRFKEVDFSKVAEAFGCVGMRVEKPGDLEGAIEHAIKLNKPVVIDVITDTYAMARRAWSPTT
jgi:acetolactate synthase I/II/III large subunit